jgi:hypothetical protein
VTTDWPSWIRWGQRCGAFIDREARIAVTGLIKGCGWCGKALSGRRTVWCSDEHSKLFMQVCSWGGVSAYVYRRDNGTCQKCGEYGSEVDHILPVKDGGTDDPANLRLLCHTCHVAVGYEQRQARAERAAAA